MRQKRAKAYRKLMSLYSMTFGFRQPYQILVDSQFCTTCVDSKIDLAKQLGVTLQGEIKPMITQCCIHELYLGGKSKQPAVDLAKTFERRKCNHREPIPGDDCLTSVVGDTNKHRYVIASQSQPLRAKLRSIPAVPLVHINRSVMVLEPPSDMTLRQKALVEEDALRPQAAPDAKLLHSSSASTSTDPPPKKKKGPKGPNPLSVKKKRVDPPSQPAKAQAKTAGHVKDEVGAKRKRAAGDEGEEDRDGNGVDEQDGHGKRKRRRKRKGISGDGEEDAKDPASSNI